MKQLRRWGWSVCTGVALAGAAWGALPMFLAKDTPIKLRLKQTLSSSYSHVNDRVEFEVSETVKVGDYVAIPAGSLAWGVVVEAAPRSRLMRSGKLSVDIRGMCLPTGEKANLRGVPSSKEALAARQPDDGPSTNVLALPALPALLFIYGKDVVLQEGSYTTAYLNQRVKVDAISGEVAPNTTCDRAPAPSRSDSEILSTVVIRSSPTDAELTIDGHYQGNAPSTVRLGAGDHTITVALPGRQTWERSVHLNGGDEINITATLEPRQPIETPGAPLSVSSSPAGAIGPSPVIPARPVPVGPASPSPVGPARPSPAGQP